MRETKFIIWLLSNLSIHHFRCYSMLLLPLYLRFHLDSLHRPLIHYIFVFPPRFPTFPRRCSAPAFTSHSSHSHPYCPHFPHSDLQLPIFALTDSQLSLYSLRSYFRKIVALVQKRTLPLFFTSSMTSSVLSPKNCLPYRVPQVKNL